MQAWDCGGSIKDHGGDTSVRQSILRNLAHTSPREATLLTVCLEYAVDGIIRVSGMLLIMRGFVRKTLTKGACAFYIGQKSNLGQNHY
jgi:hypothetical protein